MSHRNFGGILTDLSHELSRQEEKEMHLIDDERTPLDWHETIADYNGWARRMGCMGSLDKARNRYLQIAALALSAVYQIDNTHAPRLAALRTAQEEGNG